MDMHFDVNNNNLIPYPGAHLPNLQYGVQAQHWN